LRGVNADCRIGSTRSARNEDDARSTGKLSIRLPHVSRAPFLPADDEPKAIARLVKRIEHRQIALARHAEGEVDALSYKIVDENTAAGTHESSGEYEEGWAILHAAAGVPGIV